MKRLSPHTLAFRKRLASHKVDGFWVTHIPDLFYLAGYGSEACWGLIGPKHATMFTPLLALDQAKALAPGYDIQPLKRGRESFQMLIDFFAAAGWKKVGYDAMKVPDAYMTALRKLSGSKITWVPISEPARRERILKDPEEIRAMRHAGHITALGHKYIEKIAKPGMTESDLAAEFDYFVKKRGASKTAYDSIVAAGPNAAFPHHHTGDSKLKRNDMVLCDMGAYVDGYCSDLTRTFFLGSITDEGRRIYDCVARAQKRSLAAVKPGVKASEIDRISRAEIEQAGYGKEFIHSTGHGVGAEIHEAPWVSPMSTDVLEPGMVLTVEPGVYIEGFGGVRIEDDVLVTASGPEILTHFPKGLTVV